MQEIPPTATYFSVAWSVCLSPVVCHLAATLRGPNSQKPAVANCCCHLVNTVEEFGWRVIPLVTKLLWCLLITNHCHVVVQHCINSGGPSQWRMAEYCTGSQQSWNFWNCKVVLKFEVVLKSQSFSTNVLILAIVVRAQWQFNVLLAALLVCLLHTWIQFYVLFLFETVTIMVSCVTLPW